MERSDLSCAFTTLQVGENTSKLTPVGLQKREKRNLQGQKTYSKTGFERRSSGFENLSPPSCGPVRHIKQVVA